MLDPEMFSDHGMFTIFYAVMEVAASVPNIICMAQIKCEFVYYTLLVYQGRLFFRDSQTKSDLFVCEHWLKYILSKMGYLCAPRGYGFSVFLVKIRYGFCTLVLN